VLRAYCTRHAAGPPPSRKRGRSRKARTWSTSFPSNERSEGGLSTTSVSQYFFWLQMGFLRPSTSCSRGQFSKRPPTSSALLMSFLERLTRSRLRRWKISGGMDSSRLLERSIWCARRQAARGGRATGNRQQATGNRQQATGNRQQATGNRQQATGNRQQATGTGRHHEGGKRERRAEREKSSRQCVLCVVAVGREGVSRRASN
jgi:uncharacterized protein YjbJ (UPF0337 family)